MSKIFKVLLILFLNSFSNMYGQEMNVKVTVQTLSSINPVANDPSFFKDLEKKISELINGTKWTNDEYTEQEKIRGNFFMTLTAVEQGTSFRAELSFQTERPVFNASYASPMINVIDKSINFIYSDLQPLQKTTNTFYDNLSAIVSFYVYYALGADYDSFSNNGGNAFYSLAQEIITSLPSNFVRDEGWKSDGGSKVNRYWMIENVLNPRMRQYRQAMYEYHRASLDKMYDDPDRSRAVMLSSITAIGQANIDYPNTYLVQMFGDAKREEIIEIFKLADKGQKEKLKTIMKELDVLRSNRYDALN